MAGKTYPRIGHKQKIRRPPMCAICGAVARWQVVVQIGWTRGDDLAFYACEDHHAAAPQAFLDTTETAQWH